MQLLSNRSSKLSGRKGTPEQDTSPISIINNLLSPITMDNEDMHLDGEMFIEDGGNVDVPDLMSSDESSEGLEAQVQGLVDSDDDDLGQPDDDEYGRATCRKVSACAAVLEKIMPACVSLNMATAVQRGCVMYALPEACATFECATKARHFQTMDCLALVPAAAPTQPPQAQPRAPSSGLPGSAAGYHATPPPSDGVAAMSAAAAPSLAGGLGECSSCDAGGEATAAGSASCSRLGSTGTSPAASDGSAATPSYGHSQPQVQLPVAAGTAQAVEILVGGPRRLSIWRLPPPAGDVPGQMGARLQEVCSCSLEAHHYSLAVSPDGRFVAAGSERGYVFILAYAREGSGGAGNAGGEKAEGGAPSSGDGGGRGHGPVGSPAVAQSAARPTAAASSSASQSASLTPCATFCVPATHYWGMNNMVRFGSFGGATRLIVATQDRIVYLFNLPPWNGSAASLSGTCPPAAFLCPALPRWTTTWSGQSAPPGQTEQPGQNAGAGADAAAGAAAGAGRAGGAEHAPSAPQARQGQLQPSVMEEVEGPSAAAVGADGSGALARSSGAAEGPGATAAAAAGDGGARPAPPAPGPPHLPPDLKYPNAGAWRFWRRQPSPLSVAQPNVTIELCLLVTAGRPHAPNPLSTSAISGFPFALNAAVPSPDGRWLVVGCDAPLLYLLPADPDYPSKPAEVLLAPLPQTLSGRLAPGCQYLAFNDSSDRLAASYDALFVVLVYDVPRRQLLFSLCHVQWQPPLALGFLPGHPSLLLHATDREHLVVLDVEQPRTTLTRITLKSAARRAQEAAEAEDRQQERGRGTRELSADEGEPLEDKLAVQCGWRQHGDRKAGGGSDRPRINGLLLTPDCRVLVATDPELFSFQLLLPHHPWSRATHRHMPMGFKDAVRTLLCLSKSREETLSEEAGPAGGESSGTYSLDAPRDEGVSPAECAPAGLRPTGLWSLPADLVEAIIAAAARSRLAWATQDVADALAFPVVHGWGKKDRARAGQGAGEGAEVLGEGQATAAAEASANGSVGPSTSRGGGLLGTSAEAAGVDWEDDWDDWERGNGRCGPDLVGLGGRLH